MEKILLVEDEVEIADIVAKFLKRKGFFVDVVHDLAGGMQKFIPGYYTIVLLDIMLKGEKSFSLLEKIKQESPQTAVIMVSGHDNNENIALAKKKGADGFIPKPFKIDYLEGFLLAKINSLRRNR
jgi:DNA-binding response OmpR family regulator